MQMLEILKEKHKGIMSARGRGRLLLVKGDSWTYICTQILFFLKKTTHHENNVQVIVCPEGFKIHITWQRQG